MKVYFYIYKDSAKVDGASFYLNDIYRMMEGVTGQRYKDVRMYKANISPCLYSLFKVANAEPGKTKSDNFWIARYIEENQGILKTKIKKPTLNFLRSFWREVNTWQ